MMIQNEHFNAIIVNLIHILLQNLILGCFLIRIVVALELTYIAMNRIQRNCLMDNE